VLLTDGTGPITLLMTVSAANLDVDATTTISEIVTGLPPANKTVRMTTRWSGLPSDYHQTYKPSTFGYPIYHYAQLISLVEGVTLGATLQVMVTNSDGKTDMKEFRVPSSIAYLDGDGDGLLDSWEDGSYPAPSGKTISLSAMGTKRWHKDVLVEIDWIQAAAPQAAVWQAAESSFNNSPVLNPDGSRGVNLIIDRGQGGPFTDGGQQLADHDCITFDNPAPPGSGSCGNLQSFYSYKASHFDGDRLHIFHYGIFGRKEPLGKTGRGERHGNDFYVTLLGSSVGTATLALQIGSLIHELGHNLGFSHGDLKSDIQGYFLKANLPSVMNYRYQATGVDNSCDFVPDGIFTYSQGMLARLDESFVDENIGICDGKPLDLNNASGITAGPMNLNQFEFDPATGMFDSDTTDQWDDFDQWGNMLLKFDTDDSHWAMN
jgi:hypothetical protein